MDQGYSSNWSKSSQLKLAAFDLLNELDRKISQITHLLE